MFAGQAGSWKAIRRMLIGLAAFAVMQFYYVQEMLAAVVLVAILLRRIWAVVVRDQYGSSGTKSGAGCFYAR
jgi:hypothetical protein